MSQPYVTMRGITKAYGANVVLDNLDLSIGESELVSLLGPSGCGKSTTLKILAGLERAEQGEILINGVDVAKKPTRERNMGIVFQAYSLFPHLSATDNVAYGLKIRGMDKSARRARAEELLELVGLQEHLGKVPNQMSGGQQQRVALARALAIEPDVLLLDEPLSALDAKVRAQLRDEIRRIQLKEGIATLMVTHDQEEAITMSDRVGVMRGGHIEQIGSADELYNHPQTPFISQFVGIANRVVGGIKGPNIHVLDTDLSIVNKDHPVLQAQHAVALLRPEEILLRRDNAGRYTVVDKQLRGISTSVVVQGSIGKGVLRADMTTHDAKQFEVGDVVSLSVGRNDTVVDHPNTEEEKIWKRLQEAKTA